MEIRKNTPPDCWNHCPGESNPADQPSRGLPLLELSVSQLWCHGPNWLATTGEAEESAEPQTMPEECVAELRAKDQPAQACILLATESACDVHRVLACENYSTLSRLLGVTACVLRAVKILKSPGKQYESVTFSPDEIAEAETLWIVSAQ